VEPSCDSAEVESQLTKSEWVERNPIRVWRKSQKLTQADLAFQLGVGLRAVVSWEVGEVDPHLKNMGEIIEMANDPLMYRKWKEWKDLRDNVVY
jgi:DNA-binding XRE family transcriptional regulator